MRLQPIVHLLEDASGNHWKKENTAIRLSEVVCISKDYNEENVDWGKSLPITRMRLEGETEYFSVFGTYKGWMRAIKKWSEK